MIYFIIEDLEVTVLQTFFHRLNLNAVFREDYVGKDGLLSVGQQVADQAAVFMHLDAVLFK